MTEMIDDCKTKDPKDQNVCAHLSCKTKLTQDNFCFGCGFFVCDEHCSSDPPMGKHEVIEHWEEL